MNACLELRPGFTELDEQELIKQEGGSPWTWVIGIAAGVISAWAYGTANEIVKQETGKTIDQHSADIVRNVYQTVRDAYQSVRQTLSPYLPLIYR